MRGYEWVAPDACLILRNRYESPCGVMSYNPACFIQSVASSYESPCGVMSVSRVTILRKLRQVTNPHAGL